MAAHLILGHGHALCSPALNLVAAPGQRRATLDIAREIERRGFAGISVSSQYSNMAQCLGLAFADRAHPFRYRDRADLCADGRGIRADGGLPARGVGRPLSVRHRRRPPAEPRPDGRDARQAARRHPRLCRQFQIRRGDRRAAADHSRRLAQAHGRARSRDRRWLGVC